MRLILFALATVLVGAIGVTLYLGYPILRAVQASKQLMKDAQPYEQHPESPSTRILVAGDSTAYGTGAADSRDSVAGRLGQLYTDAEIVNLSQNGLKLEGLKQKLASHKEDHYELIVLQIGANDIVGFTPLSSIRTELRDVLEQATLLGDTVIVITSGNIGLSPVFRAPLSNLLSARTRTVRSIFIDEISKYSSIRYVDLYKEREVEPFNKDIPLYYAPDLFHPSGAGYGLWFEEIKLVLPKSIES